MKNNKIIYSIVLLFFFYSCSLINKKAGDDGQSDMNVNEAKYVLEYYNATLSFTDQYVRMSDIDSVLSYLDSGTKCLPLPQVSALVLNSSDTTYLTNPIEPFSKEVRQNLTTNYRRLFIAMSAFFENYNTYRIYMNQKSKRPR